MKRLAPAAWLLLASCILSGPDIGEYGEDPDPVRAENNRFATTVESFLAWHYASHPVRATYDGVHSHNRRLDPVSKEAIEGRIDGLKYSLKRLGEIKRDQLTFGNRLDLMVLESHVRSELHDLEEIRRWERSPDFYRGIISGGLYALAALSFAPPEQRMSSAIDRLLAVPDVLAAAKANLKRPAKIHTEVAIEQFGGTYRFIKNTLTEAFTSVKDDDRQQEFEFARDKALRSVEEFIDWMRKDLLPRSDGSFRIGEEAYRKKLLHEEMVETPIQQLLDDGYTLLRETQAEFKRVAGDLDPDRAPEKILRELGKDHPPAEKLLEETRAMLEDIRAFCQERLIDIPADANCLVQETPEFRRSLSFASMQIPGPFEKKAKEAYYSVTLPDPSWDEEKTEQHLSFYNRYALPLISVHEAYPGHYTQFLAVRHAPTKIRKVFGSGSFSEGWAHYTEQLVVDEGFFGADTAKARLMQLNFALLRICRYIVGIELHCRDLTYEKAVEFFIQEGYLERTNAEREARRGTSDPTYLIYTLGKMQILKLRDDYKALKGSDFSLRDFHNRFIAEGYPPVKLMRKILLGE